MVDPNRWQPLQIEHMISQNGIPVTNGVQQAVGTHWGHVTPFALPSGGAAGVPIDPGPQPRLGDPATDQALKDQVVQVIRDSSLLDPASTATIDISPGALGANSLGTNDGKGHAVNPATGQPYPPDVVTVADFGRVMAEFWADGPNSETPPGHWNVLANQASDELAPDLRIGGQAEAVDRLEWDTKLYLALNGAVHDAAIAAWGLKGHYDAVRPISIVRYMGGLGQSSDPAGPAYDPEGLPLVPGLIEVITKEKTAPGGPMADLAGHEGEIAIRAWAGNPEDPKTQVGGVTWILATAGSPTSCRRSSRRRSRATSPATARSAGRRPRCSRLHRQRVLPWWRQRLHDPRRLAQVREGPDDGHPARVGDLLRRGRPGGPVAALGRDPHRGRRLHRAAARLPVRQGRLGARAAVLRREGRVVTGAGRVPVAAGAPGPVGRPARA